QAGFGKACPAMNGGNGTVATKYTIDATRQWNTSSHRGIRQLHSFSGDPLHTMASLLRPLTFEPRPASGPVDLRRRGDFRGLLLPVRLRPYERWAGDLAPGMRHRSSESLCGGGLGWRHL